MQDRWGRKPGNFGQEMIVPRGRLHEETVYGNNHKQLRIDIKKLDNIKYCIVDWQRQAIEKHLTDNNIDLKTALKNLKKKPILYADNKVLEKVTVFIDEHVKKYNLEYSNTNKFDLKAATSIVNKNVRDIIINRLAEFDNDASKAFKNLKENPVYFNKEKGIVITQDFRIQTQRHQKELYLENGIGILFFNPPSHGGFAYWEMVKQLVNRWEEIKQIIRKNKPPFAFRCSSKTKFEQIQ